MVIFSSSSVNPTLLARKVKTETVFYSPIALSEKNIISILKNMKPRLLAEPTHNREYTFKQIKTENLNDATKGLKEHK